MLQAHGMASEKVRRCAWPSTPELIRYHDEEWGTPVHDDRLLFEAFTLGAMQAGLSWSIVLNKRAAMRKAFADFDPARVARFNEAKIVRMLEDPGIIRNRLKIAAAISNAKAVLRVQKEFGSFDAHVWQFVNGRPVVNRWKRVDQLPCRSPESDALSADMIARGFKFAGSVICYAVMQGVGMVNDHTVDCFRYKELVRSL
jgi:DNA-3-methyladenine glycosylase I